MADYDNLPTVTVTPHDKPDEDAAPERLASAPDDRNKRKPLTQDEATKLVRRYNPDITNAAVQGEVDNILRESKGDPTNDTGDGGTSGGLYQHHNTRLDGLKEFAAKEKGDWKDPDIQVRYARMEKERDYPALLKFQQTTDDPNAANEQFKRVFERPASVMWAHNPDGQPITGAGKFQVSDYAMTDAKRRHGDDSLYYMSPGEYLDLSPALEGKPFDSASGRSLMKSVDRGDQIDEIPSLETKVDGNTATVTDQDGRHRALLAQQEGVEAMPVAIRQQGEGNPTEIVGQSGNIMAHDFPKVAGYQAKPQPQSVFGKMAQALIPSAEAAEAENPFAKYAQPPQEQPAEPVNPFAKYAQPQHGEPDNAALSFAKGAARGFGETALAGQQLVGKGMEAVGIPGGEWLATDAQQGIQRLEGETAADRLAHPYASGVGDFLGGMALPGGVGGLIGKGIGAGAAGVGALQGGLGGLLTPGGDEHFWRDKALGLLTGAGAGAAVGKAGNALSTVVGGALRPLVNRLMQEGVELTPGQMAGGAAKRAEDAMASIPLLGSSIRAAQRRSIETFNRAAINRSLDDIGTSLPQGLVSGHEAIAFAQDAFTQAYDQVIPRMVGQVDNGLRTDLGGILTKAARENLPQEYQDRLRHVITNEIAGPFIQAGGRLPGDAVQKIGTQLDALTKPMRISPDPYVQQMGRYLREADQAVDSMMSRQNPALQAAKDRIDTGYAKFKTVQAAARAVGTHPDGTFTPAQLNRAIAARDRSKDKAAFARGDALMQDLAIAARDVLPQKVPDSGTPERAALMALISGHAYLEPHTGAALAAAAIPYTAPGSRAVNMAVNRLAQPAGPTRNALANMLRIGGQIAPPVAGSAAAARFAPAQPPQQ